MCNSACEAHDMLTFEMCFFYSGSSRIIVGYYKDWYKGLPWRRPKPVTSDISDWPLSIQPSSKHLRLSRCLLLPPLGSKLKMRPNITVTQQATSWQPQNFTILRWTQIKLSICLSEASMSSSAHDEYKLRFWLPGGRPLIYGSGWTLPNKDKALRLLTCSVYSKVPVMFLLLSFSWNDVVKYHCFWTYIVKLVAIKCIKFLINKTH
jgi:hypothetical protein